MNVVNPDFAFIICLKIWCQRKESGRSDEFTSRQHRGVNLPNFCEANQFAGREGKIAGRRIQGTQIVFIEDSHHLPWLCQVRDMTSLEPPNKRLAVPTQPAIDHWSVPGNEFFHLGAVP